MTVKLQQTGNCDTGFRVLDAAERLVPTRGFNAISYAGVAAEVGITTAALRYHVPGKVRDHRTCPCSRLAAQYQTLPAP